MEKYLITALSPKERAEDLFSVMSIEEKLAQTTAVGGRHQEACAKHFMGFHNSEAGSP